MLQGMGEEDLLTEVWALHPVFSLMITLVAKFLILPKIIAVFGNDPVLWQWSQKVFLLSCDMPDVWVRRLSCKFCSSRWRESIWAPCHLVDYLGSAAEYSIIYVVVLNKVAAPESNHSVSFLCPDLSRASQTGKRSCRQPSLLHTLPCNWWRLHNCSCPRDRSWPFPPTVWYPACLNFEQKFWHKIHVFCHNLGKMQNLNFAGTKSLSLLSHSFGVI